MLGVEAVPLSVEQAQLSSALRPATRAAGLSLGDRACLALAPGARPDRHHRRAALAGRGERGPCRRGGDTVSGVLIGYMRVSKADGS